MTPTTTTRMPGTPGWRQRFVEELGGLVLDNGTPRAVVRVLGWMVVCEPSEQTAGNIQDELTLSAGSVSAAVRTLTDSGMLERIAHPGERHIYYRLRSQGWSHALESRFRALVQLRQVADRALGAAGAEADQRLIDMRDIYAWIEIRIAELLEQSRYLTASGATPHFHQLTQGGPS